MSEILYRLVPKEQQEHISSSSTAEEIVKVFFFLDESRVDMLQFEDVLQELLRRVTVFHGALSQSSTMYDLLSEAYSYSTLKPNKVEYEKLNAQWYISYLLFGSNDKESLSHEEILAVYERVTKLFWHIKNPIAKEILTKLEDIIEQWYDSKEKNEFPEFDDEASSTLNRMILNIIQWDISMNHINFSPSALMILKNNFLDQAYEWYNTWRIERVWDRGDVSKEKFIVLLDKLITIAKTVEEVEGCEKVLEQKWIQTLAEEIPWEAMNSTLRNIICEHATKYNIVFKSRTYTNNVEYWEEWYREHKPMTSDNFWDCNEYIQVIYMIEGVEVSGSSLKNTIDAYKKYNWLKKFDAHFGSADYEKIEADKLLYGAKSAFMREVKAFADKVNALRNNEDEDREYFMRLYEFFVPQFEEVPTDKYASWLETWQLDETYFKTLYATWKHQKVRIIGRSSAVYSEDNEVNTGAWIYASEIVEWESYEEFCDAMTKVYESCNSPRAIDYRNKNNISKEGMGILVQEYVENWTNGHINTIMAHRPELLELIINHGRWVIRPIVYKEKLTDFVFWSGKKEDIFHYEVDKHKYDREAGNMAKDLACVSTMLERYFRKYIQIEFVMADDEERRYSQNVHVVQVRPLPAWLEKQHDIHFLTNQEHLREGRALWVCDQVYDVLPTGNDNTKKEWVVIFTNNEYASLHEDFVERSIPKKWVVIVKNPWWMEGHIETLCSEAWVVCLFPMEWSKDFDAFWSAMTLMNMSFLGRVSHKVQDVHKDFMWHTKIRIIANWLHWRIYGIEE